MRGPSARCGQDARALGERPDRNGRRCRRDGSEPLVLMRRRLGARARGRLRGIGGGEGIHSPRRTCEATAESGRAARCATHRRRPEYRRITLAYSRIFGMRRTYPVIPSITPAYRSLLRIRPLQYPMFRMPPVPLSGRIAVPIVHSPSLAVERSGPPCLPRAVTTRGLSRNAGETAGTVRPASGRVRGRAGSRRFPERRTVPR